MHRKVRATEALDRQIIHPERADAARDERVRGVLRHVGEVAPELGRRPALGVVRPAEEDVAGTERDIGERSRVDRAPAP